MKKLLFYFSIFSFFVNSCAVNKIQFNTEKINSLQKEGYKTVLNHQFIDINNLFISPEKIKSTTVNKSKKIVQINLKNSSKIIMRNEMLKLMKEKHNSSEIEMLIINNEIYNPKMKSLLFEINSIEKSIIMKAEKLRASSHTDLKGDIVLISMRNVQH